MVGLDDLDVVALAQRARGPLRERNRDVDAGRHVRRLHDRDALGGFGDERVVPFGQSGGADDHAHALRHALLEVRKDPVRAREIDQAVAAGEARSYPDAVRLADELARVPADQRVAGRLERRGELEVGRTKHHLDENAAHAAARPCDDELHCAGFPDAAATISPSTRLSFPSSKKTAMRRCSTSGLLARWRTKM